MRLNNRIIWKEIIVACSASHKVSFMQREETVKVNCKTFTARCFQQLYSVPRMLHANTVKHQTDGSVRTIPCTRWPGMDSELLHIHVEEPQPLNWSLIYLQLLRLSVIGRAVLKPAEWRPENRAINRIAVLVRERAQSHMEFGVETRTSLNTPFPPLLWSYGAALWGAVPASTCIIKGQDWSWCQTKGTLAEPSAPSPFHVVIKWFYLHLWGLKKSMFFWASMTSSSCYTG